MGKLNGIFGPDVSTTHTCTALTISIINHTLMSTIRAVINTLTCMNKASTNSTSDSECYLALDHSCNKYCDLIGHKQVSISHKNS